MRLSVLVVAAGLWGFAAAPAVAYLDALAIAAQDGDAAKVRSLLDGGANPNAYDRTYSALMRAAGGDHVEATQILIARGAKVDHRDHNGDRALLWAAQRGHAEVVRVLLSAHADVQSDDDPHRITPLMQASRYGHVEVARLLIEAGADVRRRDHVGDTALHGAALSSSAALVKLLLTAGASPDAVGKYTNTTPLHNATSFGNVESARLLVEAGAPLEVADSDGRTPLWIAAQKNEAELVRVMLAAGAKPDARDKNGMTPFVAAVGASGEASAATLLVDRTSAINEGFAAAISRRRTALAMRLAERGADTNAVDRDGRPALMGVVENDGVQLLDWFLARKVDLKRHGPGALVYAADRGREDIARKLLTAGVAVDARNADGETALFAAAGSGHVSLVRLLLEKGARRDVRDKKGRTIEDKMRSQISGIEFMIAQRNASRAYRPTGNLQDALRELRAQHAEIRKLLVR